MCIRDRYESYGKLFFSEIDAMKKSLFQDWYHQQITFAQFLEKLRSFQLSPDTCHGLYLLLADAPGATKEGQLLCSYVPKYITDYLFPEKYLHLEAELSDSRQLYFFYPAAGTDFPCSRMKDCVQSLYEHARPLFQTALSFYLAQVEPCSDSQRLCTLAEEALVQIRTATENNGQTA